MAHQHTTQPDQAFRRIAVVGFGLVGASFAAAAVRRAAYRIAGAGCRHRRTHAGRSRRARLGHGRRAARRSCVRTLRRRRLRPRGARHARRRGGALLRRPRAVGLRGIVTDTASTKARITALAERVLPHPGELRARASHGRLRGERHRRRATRPVQGAHWILCPDADTPPSTSRACTSWSRPSRRARHRAAARGSRQSGSRGQPRAAHHGVLARAAGQPSRRRPASAHAPGGRRLQGLHAHRGRLARAVVRHLLRQQGRTVRRARRDPGHHRRVR